MVIDFFNMISFNHSIAGAVNIRGHIGEAAIDQSHTYGRHQAACRETAGSYDKTTRIVVFWHISNIPPMISQSEISCNTPTFYIAALFVKYCYTTVSWLL